MPLFLSVVIPAFNEEKRIGKILEAAKNYLASQSFDYEIIIVDDGSTDATAKVANSLAKDFKNFFIIKNETNQGKGAAVKKGMLKAQGIYRLFADADDSTPFGEFAKFLPWLEKFEVIIGSRAIKDSQVDQPQSWPKVWLGRLGNKIICQFLKLNISDTQCGFKCFSAAAAQEIFSRQVVKGWGFDIEDLVLAQKLGLKIKEIGIKWVNDKNSKVSWRSYFIVLKDVFLLKKRLSKNFYIF